MKAVVPAVLAAALLLVSPAAASADVIFDPADADDLAATLAEAAQQQDVCYGWSVSVSDPYAGTSDSVGSDRGAGVPLDESCGKWVRFDASITYTSESSEAEDSATYDVESSVGGPTRTDLDALGLDFGGLTGEDPDVVIGKAVVALPLLAADKGMGKAIEAVPQTAAAPADARLTDDPGSDWWRENGGMLLWGVGLILGGAVFAWWIVRSERGRKAVARTRRPAQVPDTIPPDFYRTGPAPATEPEQAGRTRAEPPTRPLATPGPGPTAPERSTPDLPPSRTDTTQPDQKDKE